MRKIPRLDRGARRRLIKRSKRAKDPQTALRFLMIAKLGQGLSRQQVARDLACVPSTVVKAARRFAEAGEAGLLDQRIFNGVRKVDRRFTEELERVLYSVPREFGWERTTWTRELLGLEMARRGLRRSRSAPLGERSRPSAHGSRHRGRPCSARGIASAGCAFCARSGVWRPAPPKPSPSSSRTRWTSISTRRSVATGCRATTTVWS